VLEHGDRLAAAEHLRSGARVREHGHELRRRRVLRVGEHVANDQLGALRHAVRLRSPLALDPQVEDRTDAELRNAAMSSPWSLSSSVER
jgi:hypothetical protein